MIPARWLLALCLAMTTGPLRAAVEQDICFNYSCYQRATAVFSDADLQALREQLQAAPDPAAERALLAQVIGRMYAIAAGQTPIWRDRGRNSMEERGLDGAMDCIDHSINTEAFLRLLAGAGALRFHVPAERRHRFAFLVFGEHWAATLIEAQSQSRFAVDSWFHDPGLPVTVVGFERWRAGYDPHADLQAAR